MYTRHSEFRFLSKQKFAPRASLGAILGENPSAVQTLLQSFVPGEWLSIDIETTGLSIVSDELTVIGIAGKAGRIVIDVRGLQNRQTVLTYLATAKWYAFNLMFDGSMIIRDMMKLYPDKLIWELCECMVGDSMVLFKLLANEDNSARNLERAIKDVLGWGKAHWNKDTVKELLSKRGLSKGDMSKLMDTDAKAFMDYCSLDAEASWQLMEYLRMVCADSGLDTVLNEHDILFTNLLHLLIEQKIRGMQIDVKRLDAYRVTTELKLEEATALFNAHPPVKERIDAFNAEVMATYSAPLTGSKKVWAKSSDQPWLNQDVWIKGERAKPAAWEVLHGSWFRIEETSRPSRRVKAPALFNTTSPAHLKWLFYTTELVQYRVLRQPNPEAEKPWEKVGIIELPVEDEFTIDWEMTKSGSLPIDKDVRKFFGEAGKLLSRIATLRVRLQFINGLLKAVDQQGLLHPDIRVHGTVTGRCSGGVLAELKDAGGGKDALSILQLPKLKEFMGSFTAREGNMIVQTDVASLENVIMAELSKDELMLDIFASGKPHDSYMYMAAVYDPRKSAEIAEVYLPENPTKESVAAAKKLFKKERTAWKVVTLSKAYGMGAVKLRRRLALDGIYMTLKDVKALSDNYDNAMAGVTTYKASLQTEWKKNGGWVLNAMGRPMGIPDGMEKDCASRIIQSTGHGITLLLIYYVNRLRKERRIPMHPFNVDLHDETNWECAASVVPEATLVVKEAYASVNKWLGGITTIKGDVEVGKVISDFKECTDD